ncbi:MAG: hormogonium polysaccharide biosynthesis protein HpsL [Phormidesmis sp.]
MVSRSSGKRTSKRSTKKAQQQVSTSKGKSKGKGKKGRRKGKAGQKDDQQVVLSPREKLIQERAAAALRRENISFVSAVVLGCFLLGVLFALLVDPKIGVAVGGAVMCLVLSFKYQRLALYAFLIYIPFAGTVTYSLGGNSILQIAKDIFYIPALVGVYQFCRKNKLPIILPKAIKPPLIFLIIVGSLTTLVVNLPDQIGQVEGRWPLIMAIWGIKILLGYVPIVACIYYLIRNKEDLMGLLRLQAILVLVVSSLGLVQYFMLRTGMCAGTLGLGQEQFRASLEARCFVGGSLLYAPEQGQIRLPGTFVAPWQWGWFLISAAFFSFGTTFNDDSPFWRLVGLISMVAVMVMSVVSGQRIALLLVPMILAVLVVLTGQVKNLKRFLPIGVLLGLILSYLIVTNPTVITGRVDSLISRWEASPPQRFIAEQFEQVWNEQEGIFGHGVGRATNSARTFAKTTLIETYHPKLIYELGPIGLIAALSVYTALTVATFRVYRKTKDKSLRGYAASMWVFVLFISYCPYYYPLDVDPVGIYYWLAAGIILKIPELERQEAEKAALLLGQADQPVITKKKGSRRKKAAPTF